MILLIDNYDSFSYNLFQLVGEINPDIRVIRNDAYTVEEMKEKTKNKQHVDIQRYKGLGEMNADQLAETTMNPGTRTLIRVTIEDAALVERRVSVLMGDAVEPRKDWIEKNVVFSLEDDYKIS